MHRYHIFISDTDSDTPFSVSADNEYRSDISLQFARLHNILTFWLCIFKLLVAYTATDNPHILFYVIFKQQITSFYTSSDILQLFYSAINFLLNTK